MIWRRTRARCRARAKLCEKGQRPNDGIRWYYRSEYRMYFSAPVCTTFGNGNSTGSRELFRLSSSQRTARVDLGVVLYGLKGGSGEDQEEVSLNLNSNSNSTHPRSYFCSSS